MRSIFLFVLVTLSISSYAQQYYLSDTVFVDSIPNDPLLPGSGYLSKNNSFYYVGWGKSMYYNRGIVARFDTTGNNKWTCDGRTAKWYDTLSINQANGRPIFNGIMEDSLDLYSRVYYDASVGWADPFAICRINNQTGGLVWLKRVYDPLTTSNNKTQVINFNATSLLAGITNINTPNSLFIKRYGKQNAALLDSVTLNQKIGVGDYDYMRLKLVSYQDKLIVLLNDTCYRYSAFPNPTVVSKTYVGSLNQAITRTEILNDVLYIYGNSSVGTATVQTGFVCAYDLTTNTVKWRTQLYTVSSVPNEIGYRHHQVKNGFIYVCWNSLYGGSAPELHGWIISKINLTTGAIAWHKQIEVLPTPSWMSKVPEVPSTIVLDNNDDLWVSGYGQFNSSPVSTKGIMKIRGADGVAIKKGLVNNGDTSGYFASAITLQNGRIYGMMTANGKTTITVVDTTSFNVIQVKHPMVSFQKISRITAVKTFSADKYLVAGKRGRVLHLKMLNNQGNQLWSYTLPDEQYRVWEFADEGIGTSKTENRISVALYRMIAYCCDDDVMNPDPAAYDSTIFLQLDTLGVVKTRTAYRGRIKEKNFYWNNSKDSLMYNVLGENYYNSYGLNYYPPSISSGFSKRPYSLVSPEFFYSDTTNTIAGFREKNQFYPEPRSSFVFNTNPQSQSFFIPVNSLRLINSVSRESKNLYYGAGRDSVNNDMLVKVSLATKTTVWVKKLDSTYLTRKTFFADTSLYSVMVKDKQYYFRKYNAANGNLDWSVPITLPSNQVLTVVAAKYNPQQKRFTLAGYTTDTSVSTDMNSVFITNFDLQGTEIKRVIKDGYIPWKNRATAIDIAANGQTLVSGWIYDSARGYTGFVNFIDSAVINLYAPQFQNFQTTYCSANLMKTGKILNPPAAPVAITVTYDGTPVSYNPADSSFQFSIANAGTKQLVITYTYGNNSLQTGLSIIVNASPAVPPVPTINNTVLTAIAGGNSYQWYLNGTAINGATASSYTATQSGNYTYTYSLNGCTSGMSPIANLSITGIIEPVSGLTIIMSPNPVKDEMRIEGLNQSEVYLITLIDLSGKQLRSKQVKNVRNYVFMCGGIANGQYILEIKSPSKRKVLGNQMIQVMR